MFIQVVIIILIWTRERYLSNTSESVCFRLLCRERSVLLEFWLLSFCLKHFHFYFINVCSFLLVNLNLFLLLLLRIFDSTLHRFLFLNFTLWVELKHFKLV
jgi:hypothetical protein